MLDFSDTKLSMQKAVDHFKSEIAAIRTGRAVPALIENISCLAYGGASKLTVKELGTIASMDAQTLVIQPWDFSVIGEIRQGILAANVGLTPVIDNNLIRISVPGLTAERRNEYTKLLHQKMEQTRVSIRSIRSDKKKDIENLFNGKSISEDDKFGAEEELQRITDGFIANVDGLGEKKEKEINTI
ncbi:ribosome recycling factor [Candidatus Shapirobacteria bacterium CG03_land_8_20_14_0_80_40_19]|uniref:Ribosome recycling factor n=2 Tax=Candidatus Shapironibacteriota TaxID=1752721 RepID=A0A2M7BGH1_9BACT|nr:MAG: ribosome recycling factor [Candidatus Shapirobacteria bacterium CG11_big_fil_rev_8_21_14_0_20_40_12]PIV02198.1 MAG: ribosome recycling factor [Candidatus Shapirobacteria bacterium CG03_land_8_20_14_0_80_40_19]